MLLFLTGLVTVGLVLALFPTNRPKTSKLQPLFSFLSRFPIPLSLATALLSAWCLLQTVSFLLNNIQIFNKAILGMVGLGLSLFAFEKQLLGSRQSLLKSLGNRIRDIRTFVVEKNYAHVIVILLATFVLLSVVFSLFF